MKIRQFAIATVLALGLSACGTMSDTARSACLVGGAVVGGVAGGSGAAVAAGAAAGAGIAAVMCGLDATEVPPEPVAMAVADEDGDGVDDGADQCPGTPLNVAVDANGCALDSDGDGVPDYEDRCANTPAGAEVDEFGCPVAGEVVLTIDRLNFAFDSAELDAEARAALDAAVAVIMDNSEVELDLVGHTDSSGPEAYNQTLSEKRAQAAVDYLVSKGVPAGQLRAMGRGEAEPVASNDTRDGRASNRRVELTVR